MGKKDRLHPSAISKRRTKKSIRPPDTGGRKKRGREGGRSEEKTQFIKAELLLEKEGSKIMEIRFHNGRNV